MKIIESLLEGTFAFFLQYFVINPKIDILKY